MMEFLYFPEDKSEYIPAVLTLLLFVVGAAVTMILIIKASQKEEKNTDEVMNAKEQENEE